MRTETIQYTITDEDGNVTRHECQVTYKRNINGRVDSESNSVGERQEFHSGTDRD